MVFLRRYYGSGGVLWLGKNGVMVGNVKKFMYLYCI